MTEPTILVLWDIDLTLVDYSGTGRAWYRAALERAHGVEFRHEPYFPGRTERAIAMEVLAAHGVECGEEHIQAVFTELIAQARAADLRGLGRALPGASEVLAALHERPGVVQSLVTGNLPELADDKLSCFGLDRYVDMEVGGYGSLSVDRHDLVSSAVASAGEKYGVVFAPHSVVVVGDTPHDVAAATHHGMVGVGVATGRHSHEDLAASGAALVLGDLSDAPAVVDALIGCTGSGNGVNGDQLRSGA